MPLNRKPRPTISVPNVPKTPYDLCVPSPFHSTQLPRPPPQASGRRSTCFFFSFLFSPLPSTFPAPLCALFGVRGAHTFSDVHPHASRKQPFARRRSATFTFTRANFTTTTVGASFVFPKSPHSTRTHPSPVYHRTPLSLPLTLRPTSTKKKKKHDIRDTQRRRPRTTGQTLAPSPRVTFRSAGKGFASRTPRPTSRRRTRSRREGEGMRSVGRVAEKTQLARGDATKSTPREGRDYREKRRRRVTELKRRSPAPRRAVTRGKADARKEVEVRLKLPREETRAAAAPTAPAAPAAAGRSTRPRRIRRIARGAGTTSRALPAGPTAAGSSTSRWRSWRCWAWWAGAAAGACSARGTRPRGTCSPSRWCR